MSSFVKIRPEGAELFHAERRTDITKLEVAFHRFAYRLANDLYEPHNKAGLEMHSIH